MPAVDKWGSGQATEGTVVSAMGPIGGPGQDGEAVTPSDSTDLTYVSRALYVGVTGDVTVIMASGATLLFKAVPAGQILPIRVSRVKATGTTATNITSIT
jgi:hypothetical protein